MRNLAKPTGVLSDEKVDHVKSQNSIAAPDNDEKQHFIREPYSCKMLTWGHLLRVEPFSRRAINFDAALDSPDRTFFAMQNSFQGVRNNCQDNKELTPEYFFWPEFLCNHNLLDMGMKQDGQTVHDVLLPHGLTPHNFLQLHRLLLESTAVRIRLPQWIDLIFGQYQQKPHEYNIYPWYGFEEHIAKQKQPLDEQTAYSIELFQQLPIRLFKNKHPTPKIYAPRLNRLRIDSEESNTSVSAEERKLTFKELWECKDPRLEIFSVFYLQVAQGCTPASSQEAASTSSASKHIFVLLRARHHKNNVHASSMSRDPKVMFPQDLALVRLKLGELAGGELLK